ncbi:hypothetical protein NBE98_03330 [Clostridium swellfunianum]|uniref:hypothetical protein n=1 Tax=Clostridium swellfunianum TaxID=1367462 RepID=UPI00202FA0B7|nr:hypothetical protein [Clostridium swellfunianum]MCM0647408.1 hypothetical protein [Clostridium swellfunianum]
MNQKIVNLLERIIGAIISILIILRRVPIIGVVAYFIFKFIGVEIPISARIGKNVKLVHWANG